VSSPSGSGGGPPRRPNWGLALLAIGMLIWPSTGATIALLSAAIAITVVRAALAASRRRQRSGAAQAPPESVVLGVDRRGERVALSDMQLSAHGLVLGASGAGKSTTLLTIMTDQIRRGRSVVALDMKGSPAFANELAGAAASAGRPFRLWTLDGPASWNPLAHGNATELKDRLISTERFTEPHYQRAAERYMQSAIQILQLAQPHRPATLDQVVALMEPRRLAALLREVRDPVADRVEDYLAGLTSDQLSAVRGLGTRLALLSESHTGRFLSDAGERTIDLRRALAGPEVVVFSLNSSTYGKLSAQVGTLVVQDLIAAAGSRLSLPEPAPAMIAIDEFSALDSDNVVSLLARGRESGVPVLLATQEFADLERAGRGVRDQVSGVTALKIAHRQEVPDSARMIAEMVGTERVWEHSYQTGRHLGFGPRDTGRGTRREVERFIIDPNEIKSLPVGEAVVITKLPRARAQITRVAPPERPPAPPARPDDRRRAGPEL
jgi:type IV secretory pathway TraG/TraD family ATPase VirD4